MGPRLSKNILEIQQIESGTLAKFWSDGRNVAKVIANLVQPFCQKQALAPLPQLQTECVIFMSTNSMASILQ